MEGTVICAKRAEGRVARAGTSPATAATGSGAAATAGAAGLATALRGGVTFSDGVAEGAFAIALTDFKTSFEGNGALALGPAGAAFCSGILGAMATVAAFARVLAAVLTGALASGLTGGLAAALTGVLAANLTVFAELTAF